MPAPHSPAAVLLDSGGVLMRPIGGRWNPRADFEANVRRRNPEITDDRFATAIAVGNTFMDDAGSTPDLDRYHAVMLADLGVEATPELLAELIRPVAADVVLELFDDVIPTLEELRSRGVRMAVVSDAWPNLPQLHAELGLDDFFDAYAISAVLGVRKPDPKMYHHASDALGLDPSACLFVDDDPDLVAAAIVLGYQGRWMNRTGRPSADETQVPAITSLRELIEYF
jgi:HAD superfamily hydrolase (TIGR01509 family)